MLTGWLLYPTVASPQQSTLSACCSYTVDIPGPVQTIIDPITREVVTEGALKVPAFCVATEDFPNGIAPFLLPFSTMLPKRGEVENLLVPVAISASHVAFNSVRMEPTWMTLGQSAGVAAAMAAKGKISVGDINVAQLQGRLRSLGQLLEPLPPLPPPPPPPPALSGPAWYAYRKMWEVQPHEADVESRAVSHHKTIGSGGVSIIILATEDGSLLKRSFNHSNTLPPADVRKYKKGQAVALTAAPVIVKGESDYWLVKLTGR